MIVNDTSTEIIIFVNCGAVGLWGTFIGVVLWITIHVKHIHNLLTYVNDTFSWDFSNNTLWYAPYKKFFPVKQTYLLQLWDELGIPHKCPKQLFSSWLTIIGFNVNMDTMTITMLAQAYTNLIAAICVFTNTGQRCPLHEFQRLAGWMNWSLNVYLLLCPGMSTLYNKMAGKTNSHQLIWVSKALCCNLTWFTNNVMHLDGVHVISATGWGVNDADITLFCDTCPSGLGFWYPAGNIGFHHPFDTIPGNHSIFYCEALTVVLAIGWAV